MSFRRIRCPDCRSRQLEAPWRTNFDGSPAPVLGEERLCTRCGAWLWVVGGDVMPAAARLYTMSLQPSDERLEAVLAGIAATEAFRHELQRVSSAAWPSATVKRFS
jgi:hypothetical protein